MKLFYVIKFMPFYILSLFPFFILHFFSDIFVLIFFRLFKYRREIIFKNITNSFPEKSTNEIQKIIKKFHRHFSDIFIEAVKILTISKDSISKRFKFVNPDLVNQYYDQGKSIILYMAHYGNWEWFASLPIKVNHQMLSFYQVQSNRYFDQLMKLIRERFGNMCIQSKTGYKTLVTYNNENIPVLTLILGDQSPRNNSKKQWIHFLNRETAFLTGADHFARRLGHVLLYPNIKKMKRGFYEIEFIEIDPQNTSEDLISKYASCLEKNIQEQAEMWLWSHKRWKLTKPKNHEK